MIFQNRVLSRICKSKKEEVIELRKLYAKELLKLNSSKTVLWYPIK
jgi:hypothetical protein